ncbi:hypothetical protein HN51_002837 [Arachis hypogaea]|uniref:Uncharacterized protein n=2 Tax=Arachis TaxID=3817 RepID=A0A445EKZ9_ARAHY|nr:uncharacterized protein LOC107466330 [Arachis duranensis]XP_025613046.1 uncharacterized protein LOC112706122 [Arachis hypogaea]QHO51085.1 uncharacterized protein DS421_1g27860 [Arachis hypogaea]RYR76139.1 hypothetical protein Ahy_A01g000735 [Arachis hypogaea]
MKKLYRKGTVHPSPPVISDHHLAFLPPAILTLTVALSPQDLEVLAYLLTCPFSSSPSSSNPKPRRTTTTTTNNNGNSQKVVVEGNHPPLYNCGCFICYKIYWERWDNSPNQRRIHEIIDAYEAWLESNNEPPKNKKKDKRNKKGSYKSKPEQLALVSDEPMESAAESSKSSGAGRVDDEAGDGGGDVGVEGGEEKGPVRRLVSFIGDKIWGGWGQGQ